MNSRYTLCARLASLTTAVVCALIGLASASVAAQSAPDDGTRAAARDLGRQGIDAYRNGDFAAASGQLEKAYSLFATPTLGLWSARALRQRGQWVEAAERYRETLRLPTTVGDPAVQKSALVDATAELEALVAKLPAITIELVGADAAGVLLSLDGGPIPSALLGVRRPMNPGIHRVAAVRGSERAEAEVELVEQEHKLVELRLSFPVAPVQEHAPAKPARKPPRVDKIVVPPPRAEPHEPHEERSFPIRPLAIAALALGGSALLASGVTALIAEGECSSGRCATSSAQDTYDPLRTASTVSFWSGAALAVGGTFAWLFAPKPSEQRSDGVTWTVSPLGLHISGAL